MTDKKKLPTQTTAPEAPAAQEPAPKTEADKMWDEIKDLPIEMFALPNQTVAQHCSPVPVDPAKLYLVMRSTAVLPSLEVSIQKGFNVEMADRFAVVTRKVPSVGSQFPKK